jgi:hypothetical protein
MTSEPDSKPGRRPPTIELTATEVEKPASREPAKSPSTASSAEAAAAKPAGVHAADADSAGKGAGRSFGSRLKSHAVSAGIGAILVVAIVAALWIEGFIPSREAGAPSDAAAPEVAAPSAATPNTSSDISARLDKIERSLQAQANRMAAAEAQTKSFADSLAALTRRVDDVAATSQSAAKSADAAHAAADAAKNAAQSNIDGLANRIAALESAVKALSDNVAHPPAGAEDQAARLTIAAEALRAAVERGAPYQAELAAVQALGVDQNAAAPLVPYAAGGVPSAAALAHDLAALTPALQRAADTAPGETGFLGRIENSAQRLVRITPVDAPVGNDPSAVLARITLDAARADIAAALTDVAALPDSAKPAATDWVKQAEARNAAIAASRQIAAAALAALSKPAAQ